MTAEEDSANLKQEIWYICTTLQRTQALVWAVSDYSQDI
jgi:hypothetical protein